MAVVKKKTKRVELEAQPENFGKPRKKSKATKVDDKGKMVLRKSEPRDTRRPPVEPADVRLALDEAYRRVQYQLYGDSFHGGSGKRYNEECDELGYITFLCMTYGAMKFNGGKPLKMSKHEFKKVPLCKDHR